MRKEKYWKNVTFYQNDFMEFFLNDSVLAISVVLGEIVHIEKWNVKYFKLYYSSISRFMLMKKRIWRLHVIFIKCMFKCSKFIKIFWKGSQQSCIPGELSIFAFSCSFFCLWCNCAQQITQIIPTCMFLPFRWKGFGFKINNNLA